VPSVRWPVALTGLALLAGCQAVPRVEPPPAQAPTPAPAPPPPAPEPAAPAPDLTWEQAPATPGNWRYARQGGETVAMFGTDAARPLVRLSCDTRTREVTLAAIGAGSSARTLTIRTSSGALQWAASGAASSAGGGAMIAARRPASDPGFDWIAYSRGRIAVEVPGATRLVVPLWAEVARVIEDCRG